MGTRVMTAGSDRTGALNRMGWFIALAGAWVLAVVALLGSSPPPVPAAPHCLPGWYPLGSWCVRDGGVDQAAPVPAALILVVSGGVGPVGIEPTTEGL